MDDHETPLSSSKSGAEGDFFQPLLVPTVDPIPDAVHSYLCTYLTFDEFKCHFDSAGIINPRTAALPLDPRQKQPQNSVLWAAFLVVVTSMIWLCRYYGQFY